MKIHTDILKEGMKGGDIAALQAELVQVAPSKIAATERADARFGDDTRVAVTNYQEGILHVAADGIVTEALAAELNKAFAKVTPQELIIHGQVLDKNNEPIVKAIVNAYDRDPVAGKLTPLGQTSTGDQGEFCFIYFLSIIQSLGKQAADLVVTVGAGPSEIEGIFARSVAPPYCYVSLTLPTPFVVDGHVTRSDAQPFQGFVVAQDHDPNNGVRDLGKAITRADGSYSIEFGLDRFDSAGGKRIGPELVVMVLDDRGNIVKTSELIHSALPHQSLDLVIDPQQPSSEMLVRGHVTFTDSQRSRPVVGARVVAVDVDLRLEQVLGEFMTGNDGYYEIHYSPDKFSRAEKASADLVVRVYVTKGELAVESPILYNAPDIAECDLVVPFDAPGVQSEWEIVIDEVIPLLGTVELPNQPNATAFDKLADLKDSEIDFVAGETGLERDKIADVVAACRSHLVVAEFAKQLNVDGIIEQVIFYGLAREGLPMDLAGLGDYSPDARSSTLQRAINENIIPKTLQDSLPKTLANLDTLVRGQLLQTAPLVNSHSTEAVLATVVAPDKQQKLFEYLSSHQGTLSSFWVELATKPEFQSNGLVPQIQLSLQLGALTQNNVPLMQALQQKQVKSLRDLVAFEPNEWMQMIKSGGANTVLIPGIKDSATDTQIQEYVQTLTSALEARYPTDVAAKIVNSGKNIGIAPANRQAVSTFLANAIKLDSNSDSPEFDIRSTHIDNFVTKHGAAVLQNIPATQHAEAVSHVKRLQRVSKLAPNSQAAEALLATQFDSSQSIAEKPRGWFIENMKGTLGDVSRAAMVYDRASTIALANLQLRTTIYQAYNAPHTLATGSEEDRSVLDAKLKESPTWSQLFAPPELCDCEHCQSMYSPSAYFVDLLHMLEHPNKVNEEGKTPFQILLERRPDLEHITLSCENTDTTLPYVDLVNEILESYVVLRKPDKSAAHDTGDLPSAVLGATPQFINDEAYLKLKEAVYPLTLPYDRDMETMRAYLAHLGSSRYEVLQAFQKSDTAYTDIRVEAEYLKIGQIEYEILTGEPFDSANVRTWTAFQLYGFDSYRPSDLENGASGPEVTVLQRVLNELGANPGLAMDGHFDAKTEAAVITFQQSQSLTADGKVNGLTWNALEKQRPGIVRALLLQVPLFLNQTGLAYSELVEIVKTRFLNPNQNLLFFLGPIKISFAQLNQLVTTKYATIEPKIQTALQNAGITVDQLKAWTDKHFDQIRQTIVLDAPTSAECDLTVTRVQHLDGTDLDDAELVKFHRLVRVWRKLGWSVRELDRALHSLTATEIDSDVLLKLAQIQHLREQLNISFASLLSFWSDIDTAQYGESDDSLYTLLFQNRATYQPLDSAFALNPERNELVNTTPEWQKHSSALLAALRTSAQDLALIQQDSGVDEKAEITLANLSKLYRYAVLASALKLRIGELLSLKTLSGVNPFEHPLHALQFIEVVHQVRDSGFSVAELDYLFRHRVQPQGGIAPRRESILAFAKILREGLNRISLENGGDAATKSLQTLGEEQIAEMTRAKLALIFTQDIVETAIGLIEGTSVFTTHLDTLPADYSPSPSVKGKVRFDLSTKLLSTNGPLTTQEKDELKKASLDKSYTDAVEGLYAQQTSFVDQNLASFLDADAKDKLLNVRSMNEEGKPIWLDIDGNETKEFKFAVQTAISAKYEFVLGNMLPYLRKTLQRAFVIQTLSDTLKLSPEVTAFLIENLEPKESKRTLIQDFLALEATESNAEIKIDSGSGTQIWRGALVAPGNASYTFSFVKPPKAEVKLWIGDDSEPLLNLDANGVSNGNPREIALKAGQLYDLTLELTSMSTAESLELEWTTASMPKAKVPAANLFPGNLIDSFNKSYTLMHKASLQTSKLRLATEEVIYFAKQTTRFDFALAELPLQESDANAAKLFKWWKRLYDYVTLRDNLPRGETQLLTVFATAERSTLVPEGFWTMLEAATGWDESSIKALVKMLDLKIEAFKNEIPFLKLQAVIRLEKRLGISPAQIESWATNSPSAAQAKEIKEVVRSKYDEETWLTVAKSLNDGLRSNQKNALVAYVLAMFEAQRANVSSSNQLFEYFLIDVEMDPCMLTSRIKQAISSVQTFVQRCLMNLEARVSPEAIEADAWKWMKNYRVWEANRKVFLYPANWIEEELRDNKTPFFKELESELMQNDLTMESAETAFRNYLDKVEQVARLEICGLYVQVPEPGSDDRYNTLHVIGRTFNTPHHYYYRRYQYDPTFPQLTWDFAELKLINTVEGGFKEWTPWEKIPVDIEGDHLIPVFWNRRLYIFWPIFTEKAEEPSSPNTNEAVKKYWEIKLAWSEYRNDKWSSKQLSDQGTNTPANRALPKKAWISFKSLVHEDLTIQVYFSPWTIDSRHSAEFQFTNCSGNLELRTNQAVHLRLSELGLAYLLWNQSNTSETLDASQPQKKSKLPNWTGNKLPRPVELVSGGGSNRPATPAAIHGTARVGSVLVSAAAVLGLTSKALVLTGGVGEEDQNFSTGLQRLEFPILGTTTITSTHVDPHQYAEFLLQAPFFFQDNKKVFCVVPMGYEDLKRQLFASLFASALAASLGGATSGTAALQQDQFFIRLRFDLHYHPYVCEFIKSLERHGIEGLLTLENQRLNNKTSALAEYAPNQVYVDVPHPTESVSFDPKEPYSIYNWEIFFHSVLRIATRLTQNQRFEDAERWFHFIFNPTNSSDEIAPQRYWQFDAFKKPQTKRVEELMLIMSTPDKELATDPDPDKLGLKRDLESQWQEIKNHPFQPHRIARLRPVAYMENVVMKYLDNLIAWGDQLFSRDTIESINEATQLYILAANILGPRPQRIPPRHKPVTHTYAKLKSSYENLNAIVQFENEFPSSSIGSGSTSGSVSVSGILGRSSSLYFCVPQNDKLLGYWDLVEDRLFKIRHCMNIEGIVRELPLFEPPIDPALLVRAAAAGVDLSSVLNDLNARPSPYRFNFMLQKALELCAEVKSLGAAFLAALEKRDAEALALLRSGQEISLLKSVRDTKAKQVEEAKAALEGLAFSQQMIKVRLQFYQSRLGNPINEHEKMHMDLLGKSMLLYAAQTELNLLAGVLGLIPDFKGGVPTTIGTTFGGSNITAALQGSSQVIGGFISMFSNQASMNATLASYDRRSDDWKLQADLATLELKQIEKQIAAAEIRKAIAELELRNHDKQIENASQLDEFMHTKLTNHELYDYMVAHISGVYFQSYQLAYDAAKRAERAYRFELGLSDSNFVQYGYWDSLKKGLLSGEKLHYDLKRMEMDYLDKNKREYEITRHISLMLHDPIALIRLKETGQCVVRLPEELFDRDYPGHFMRRIKNVTLTIPAVTGPYTNINCTLTLLKNKIRINSKLSPSYLEQEEDTRFVSNFASIQSIATSHGQNDGGLFELNFRDERYLPFEGAGVISEWRIEMPPDCNTFDLESVTDVVLKLSYTAREGGDLFRQAARNAVITPDQTNLVRMFSVRHEFPDDWYRFIRARDSFPTFTMNLTKERFPLHTMGKRTQLNELRFFLKLGDSVVWEPDALKLKLAEQDEDGSLTEHGDVEFQISGSAIQGLPFGGSKSEIVIPNILVLTATETKLFTGDMEKIPRDQVIQDIWVACVYSISNL